ncbi:hypothetical protein [Nonomuraea helvata]|uniref:FtsX-like permease family protein n=1 Tax=Nonomuraea helvata TaxID=37484 RepID=A0ABV5RSD3_9ACTN
MRHHGVRLVYVVMLVVSVLLAFLVLQDLDKEPTLGETATIWIQDTRGSASGVQTALMVTSYARDHRVSIVREVDDFRDPDGLLHLYIAAGDAGSAPAAWLRRGFSSFGGFPHVETHPFERIGDLDPRGMYQVYGPRGAVGGLRAEFAGLGLTGDVVEPLGLGFRISRFALPPLGPAFLVVALSVVLAVGASVLLSAKGYGVLRLQGMSFLAIARWDLRRLAPFWLIAAASITAITLAFLGLYNGFARLGLFAVVAGGVAATLSLLALMAHLGALALVARSDILHGLKGAVAPGPAMASAYLVRIIAALLVLVVGGSTLVFGQDLARRQESGKYFAALGAATYIALPGSRTREGGEKMLEQVGRWLRQADKRGQVVAVFRWPLEQFGSTGARLPHGDLLFVNETFLTEQPILDPSGRRYGPDPRGRVRVIVPERLRRHAGVITANAPLAINPADEGKGVRRTGVEQVWARDGQTVFTFGAWPRGYEGEGPDGFPLDRSLVRDPVLVVIPNGSPLVTERNYSARATQDGIVFTNPRDVLAALGREVPKEDIADMAPVAQRAAADYAQSVHKLWISVLNLTAALAVLFITGIGVCEIYARKDAQAVFAKHISGWSFWAIHWKLFVLDGVVAIAILAWVGWDNWTRLATSGEFTAQGVPPPPDLPPADWWELAPAAGVTVLATALLVAALRLAHHRIVTEHAADV